MKKEHFIWFVGGALVGYFAVPWIMGMLGGMTKGK